jgi:hypothetical protein
MQIYDAQVPERTCLGVMEIESPELLAHSNLPAEEEQHGLPGDVNRRVMPDGSKHKNLWPLDAWDVLGWLIGALTLFIAAGTESGCAALSLSTFVDVARRAFSLTHIRKSVGARKCAEAGCAACSKKIYHLHILL